METRDEKNQRRDKAMELYTIGYEGLSQEDFRKWLCYYNITVVADVRRLPLSRKSGFSKSDLTEFLSTRNINYINFQTLGTSKEMRAELKRTGDYGTFFEKYQGELPEHYEEIDNILSLINSGEKVVLLCFEKNPEFCHRKILAEEIKQREGNGLKVKHLNQLL